MTAWDTVFSLVERFEDALVVQHLFESREPELLANNEPLQSTLGPTDNLERALAGRLAARMKSVDNSIWTDTDFYRPARGPAEPSASDIKRFLTRCSQHNITLTYADGRPAQ